MKKNVQRTPYTIKDSEKEQIKFKKLIELFKTVKLPWILIITYIVFDLSRAKLVLDYVRVTGDVVDAAGNVDMTVMTQYLMYMGSSMLVGAIGVMILVFAREIIIKRFRSVVWSKLIRSPQSEYDKDGGQTLVTRITSDSAALGWFVALVTNIISTLFTFPRYVDILRESNEKMFGALVLLAPLSIIFGFVYGRLSYKVSIRNQSSLANSTAYLIERTKNLNLIKASGTYEMEEEESSKVFHAQFKAGMFSTYASLFDGFYYDILSIAEIAIPFMMGAVLVSKGEMTVDDVVVFYSVAGSFNRVFRDLAYYWSSYRGYMGHLKRVSHVMDTESEDVKSGKPLDQKKADIEVRNVTFGYDEKPVLKDLNCVIPKGKVTAIIGSNGSGKTTLFRIVERLYKPDKGGVFIGGQPVENYNLVSWRKSLVAVAQGCPVISGTIRENITYGCTRELTEQEIMDVAKKANVWSFAQHMPEGLDSQITSGGRNLSGGQRQCIAIARALMNNPDYLLLDEATSSLDNKSANMVSEAMMNLMEGRTVVIIAHSLAAIKHADNVLVMNNGQIVSQGTPEDIIKTSDEYRGFVMSQVSAPATE